ncbi:MAG: class I SAM-dependent rRNA methyltransferase [Cyanobacteria bacterium]|nr:class I SAM-dependent rRNA methyltransferase [Cyanobacteriota bacterium]MDW8201936.1 class I SAM-dependent rRNA methyltransferase [Cyanobacteriota bacterium SKYGB_h_bin112]
MAKLPAITVPPQLKERLAQGHPWIYRDKLPADVHFTTGEWVRVRCGNWSGFGLWDNKGPIALRIFSQRQLPDPRWLHNRVQAAWELRSPLREQHCTTYRWLFGEGDGLPGITVDLYGEVAVVQTYMESATVLLDWLVNALRTIAPLRGILWRTQHSEVREDNYSSPDSKTQLLWGEAPAADLVVKEHGLLFQVNLQAGQKTGLFLDHRENRRFVGELSRGKTVLNCFAYTGAFSLYALRGGASHVTSVDIGKHLAAVAEANLRLNGLAGDRHTFVTADCFDLLQRYGQERRTFDMVILDPPSFAKSKQNRFAAIRAYTKLNALALSCVAPHGLLVSASCTSQVSPEAFKDMLASAGSISDRRLQILHEAGQPLDHPVPAAFPEGRYLKFVVSHVSPPE